MKEKFSDFEGMEWLAEEGEFLFEVTDCELKDAKEGPCAVITAKCDKGIVTIRHSLSPKARWSYNKLIKCCLNLNTREKIDAFELDYETVGNDLIGKKFMGIVECQPYKKTVKKLQEDGTFDEVLETKESYKIIEYDFVK